MIMEEHNIIQAKQMYEQTLQINPHNMEGYLLLGGLFETRFHNLSMAEE